MASGEIIGAPQRRPAKGGGISRVLELCRLGEEELATKARRQSHYTRWRDSVLRADEETISYSGAWSGTCHGPLPVREIALADSPQTNKQNRSVIGATTAIIGAAEGWADCECAGTGTNIWLERSEDKLKNIFEMQDCMTSSIVGAIAPRLERTEIERARHKATENLDAATTICGAGLICISVPRNPPKTRCASSMGQ